MERILLDRYGDAPVPEGYGLVEDETTFLSIADSGGNWFIRGSRLCEWAEAFLTGRRIRFRYALSPIRELCDAIPSLTPQQAADISGRLQTHYSGLPRPLSIYAVAEALYPIGWWEWPPSLEHAAEWLVWLDQHTLDEAAGVLVRSIAEQWRQQAPRDLELLYQVADADMAHQLLDSWLSITCDRPLKNLPRFPLEVPSHWQELASEAWRMSLIETCGTVLDDLLKRDLPQALRQILAEAAFDYFQANPQCLTETWLKSLAPMLSSSRRAQLRRRLQPPVPSDVPKVAEEVLAWFQEQYLPFREWQWANNDQQALSRVLELAGQFAQWYFEFYPRALVKVSDHLGMFRTAAIRRRHAHSVLLLIVLDGLHQLDAQHVLDRLLSKTGRLTKRDQRLIFTPLPTITQFAKEALLKGVLPLHFSETALLGEDISESKSPAKRLGAAQRGDLFIWRIQEPDYTYHKKNNFETLEREVEGQLETVAQKIADVVQQVSPRIALEILLTTDHGRLLGTSQRCVPIPAGMQAHGRAAWGSSGREFPEAGFIIDDNLAFLYGERFGLSEDAAIVLDQSAFYTNDGKQGQERYAHGGVFPEEVIVPWIVLARDSVPEEASGIPQLRISASGKGIARQNGRIVIHAQNANEIPLVLNTVTIQFGSENEPVSHSLGKEISAFSSYEADLEFTPWPTKDVAQETTASAEFCWPTGDCVEIPMSIALESDEMYSRDLSLLDGLEL